MTYDNFDLFEAYTNQTLSDKERQELENRLHSDVRLQSDFREYQQFRHSIEAVKLKEQLERIHKRLEKRGEIDTTDRPPQPLKSAFGRRQTIVLTVIVVLLLVGGLYRFSRPSRAEQTYVAYYQPEPVSRGAATCSPSLMPGIQAYRSGQYKQALQEFSQLPAQQLCVSYYVGLTQLALNQEKEAITSLKAASADTLNEPALVRQKAEWYLALAYLKAGQITEAKQQLTIVVQQPDQPFRQVATKALATLEDD
ncbi:hypothetical protein GCM10028806_56340 [Spirosoma terrae]|uniref:Tetratricopeptide repeat protein n=1 Tax=Spirosoma terrae TaxID=1968276 RepID=A0A6L9L8E7_9BACT|nr:hypothetical protein [Spirosoma terrae]NDU96690.1 hypothetical protein [Spirosoma terrae]